ncbi:hypothetical protein Pcinc_044360 [Petrolisthes cinctipes]|uniref:Uncharacterized protein n=1 Tax=Petrolisthes cinctipes TaxID=88211 RepID=A0AAE1BEG5_PETCI|nr:hypothetical protein Pcinc_044360 [Petrolisthes cinctipes]
MSKDSVAGGQDIFLQPALLDTSARLASNSFSAMITVTTFRNSVAMTIAHYFPELPLFFSKHTNQTPEARQNTRLLLPHSRCVSHFSRSRRLRVEAWWTQGYIQIHTQ